MNAFHQPHFSGFAYCGVFGDRPAPDIAANSVRILAEMSLQSEPIGSNIVDNEMYMDDICHSTTTAEAASNARDEANARGKFEIKRWNSSQPSVDSDPDNPVIDVLGHRWEKETDVFSLKVRDIQLKSMPVTKRVVLGPVANIWDPLGILAPVAIAFRIDLQDLWRR